MILLALILAFGQDRLQAQVNLLRNGSFDNGFTYWTLSYGGLVTINYSTSVQQYADGSTGAVGLSWITTLYQNIPTMIGQQYDFYFYMADWGPNGVPDNVVYLSPSFGDISLGTVSFSGAGHTYLNMGWEKFDFTVTADSTTTPVTFYNPAVYPSNSRWPAIDDVWVTPIPEPSVCGLTLLGVIISASLLRKRMSPNTARACVKTPAE